MVTIIYGVPQDSVLGLFLLLIFVDALHVVTNYLDPIMFAGDTNLFYSHGNGKTLSQVVNSELQLVNNWFSANKFLISAKE